MDNKLVSICIPTYNSANFLEESLLSIISQTYRNIEIIIGDNSSTDNTSEIVKKYQIKDSRIKYHINETNLGLFGNCNKLISMSSGEYVAIFHSDDIYDSKIIEKQVDALENNSDLPGIFTNYERVDEHGVILKNTMYPILVDQRIKRINLDEFINVVLSKAISCFCCPSSMIRKGVYEKLGGYDSNLTHIGDQDMWSRILLEYGYLGILKDKLIQYRVHSKQLSSKYIDIERKDISIPLRHVRSFIYANSLERSYNNRLLKSEAIDFIVLAALSVKRSDYISFCENISKSRLKYNLGYKTKIGIMQNIPFLKLSYFIFKIFKK